MDIFVFMENFSKMDANTWTYTPQRAVPAKVYDEQGCLIASIHNLDDDEANQIAALMAAAPRLLAAAKSVFDSWVTTGDVSVVQFDALSKAIAATEVSE